jgi:hypothetical protein
MLIKIQVVPSCSLSLQIFTEHQPVPGAVVHTTDRMAEEASPQRAYILTGRKQAIHDSREGYAKNCGR